MQPSSWHGVTTVVMGNCGVGFAPCKPGDHERLIQLMEGVEDIPFPVLVEGLPWNWESFPDYLDALEGAPLRHRHRHAAAARGAARVRDGRARRGPRAGDRGRHRGHGGARAARGRGRRARLLDLAHARTTAPRDGQPTPTLTAGEDELTGIALGLAAAGKGVLQVVSDFADADAEFAHAAPDRRALRPAAVVLARCRAALAERLAAPCSPRSSARTPRACR